MCSAAFISRGVSSLLRRRLGRQRSQQLLQVQAGIGVGLANFFLQQFGISIGISLHLAESGQQTYRLDHLGFLQRNRTTTPGLGDGPPR